MGIGPQIPPEVAARLGISVKTDNTEDETPRSIGPTMPPKQMQEADSDIDDDKPRDIGPAMPPTLDTREDITSSGSEDEAIGPSLDMAGCSEGQARQQTLDLIEARTAKHGAADPESSENKRGSWMLVPPTRQSKNPDAPESSVPLFDDSWTETPAERRAKKEKEKRRQHIQEEETPDMKRRRKEAEDQA
ncbi:hypothetical protein EC988_009125, partial [Linderina pennispora]